MLRSWRHVVKAPTPPTLRRTIADSRPFREGDLVLLRRKDDRSASPILSRPLKAGHRIDSHRGAISHDDIIGKSVRDIVSVLPKRTRDGGQGCTQQKKLQEYRLYEVKLEEYVRLSKRLVTPIYPADARLIVDLLDLHPAALHDGEGGQKLEILEAGTGHGALTLYLARAICGANVPYSLNSDADEAALSAWKSTRKAVLHTIDVVEKYSRHAESVVRGFRNGLYHPHIDFHVGDVRDWVTAALDEREGNAFLSHAFLDLPNADHKLDSVARALRVDGTLIVFNPSITQIMDVAKKIRIDGIPLELETVVELGVNGGSGGREWDVRPVKPRAMQKVLDAEILNGEDAEPEMEREEEQMAADSAKTDSKDGWSMVCRPKVGDRVVGGGFLGVWKKQRRMDASQ